jgi:hypothetical protein
MICRACGSDRLTTIFEMDPMPLAGAFAITRDAALSATKYPIEWRWCEYCGLVNVFPDIPDTRTTRTARPTCRRWWSTTAGSRVG